MSLQLVCINYGSLKDAFAVVEHCVKVFPIFDKVTLLHPEVNAPTILTRGSFQFIKAQSRTQNECCLYEMPQYITCDHALGIQWDGFIVNPDAWTDEFLEYDLVAPPWPLTNLPNPAWRVGSGGFVLFSKRMARLWGSLCAPHPAPNDWQMGAIQRASFEKRGMKYAPLDLAMRFGVEIPLDDQPPLQMTPFGFHGFRYEANRQAYHDLVYGKTNP